MIYLSYQNQEHVQQQQQNSGLNVQLIEQAYGLLHGYMYIYQNACTFSEAYRKRYWLTEGLVSGEQIFICCWPAENLKGTFHHSNYVDNICFFIAMGVKESNRRKSNTCLLKNGKCVFLQQDIKWPPSACTLLLLIC